MNKERGEQPTELSIEKIAHIAREVLLRDGHHDPTLIAEGTKNTLMVPIDKLAKSHEGRAEQMRAAGRAFANMEELGSLKQVFSVMEVWMSLPEGGVSELPEVRPSQDPQRREALVISGRKLTAARAQTIMFEMLRDEEGELREVKVLGDFEEGFEFEDFLLNALVEGYEMGRSSKN